MSRTDGGHGEEAAELAGRSVVAVEEEGEEGAGLGTGHTGRTGVEEGVAGSLQDKHLVGRNSFVLEAVAVKHQGERLAAAAARREFREPPAEEAEGSA